MFQFSGFPPYDYGFIIQYMEFVHVGFPIRKSTDLGIFAPPRSLSQLITSFFGSQCQGIRPVLFLLNRFCKCIALHSRGLLFLVLTLSCLFLTFDVFLSFIMISHDAVFLSRYSVFKVHV